MSSDSIPFATVEEALEEIRQGRQIVLVDDHWDQHFRPGNDHPRGYR